MTDTTTDTDIDTNEDVSGLKAKNAELMKSLRDQKTLAKSLEDRLSAIEQERDDAADTSKSEIEKAQAKFDRELKKRDDALAKMTADLSTLKIDNVIKDSIAANNVLPAHVRAVTLMLRDGVKMENGEAVMADGTPLADATKAFFSSADATHYVSAKNNSGGGAPGSTTKSGAWAKAPMTASEKLAWDREAVANPGYHNSLADSWGRPDLKV